MFSPDVLARLWQADRLPYVPHTRESIRNAPKRAILFITDGITPEALARAHTPTFDSLAARGVSATDARSIFPTITGPAHTSILTGARVATHGFLYPKMLDAYGNRLMDFTEGLMRAETVAEAWRPQGIVSVGIGSRYLRGADAMVTEGVFGEDFVEITDRAIAAVREWEPHFLMVVFYVADTMGHLFGPEAAETLAAIEAMDTMTARVLDAYAVKGILDETCVAVVADHGMVASDTVVGPELAESVGALAHGRLALAPRTLSESETTSLWNDPRVDSVFGRDELELLGAWGARWGEQVILLKEGCMFPHARKLVGYHGAWSRIEQHVPLIVSGAGIRAGAALETCEIIDLAPTLSLLLGGNVPEQAEGRVLWEALDLAAKPNIQPYVQLIDERGKLLAQIQALRSDLARQVISAETFIAEQADWKHAAERNIQATREESRKLRYG